MGTQEVITETQIKQRLLDLEEQNRKLQLRLSEHIDGNCGAVVMNNNS